MEVEREIVALLQKKKQLFERFESITEQMLTDSPDAIDHIVECVKKRQELKERIDELDYQIDETVKRSENGSLLFEASKNRGDYSCLNEGQQEVFKSGQEIFEVIFRIRNMEPQIQKNMESMMGYLREQIKKNKNNTKLTGYMQTMGLQASKGVLYDKKR